MTARIDDILAQREKTHGDFREVARVANALREALGSTKRQYSHVQAEALGMICSKLARIACGDPDNPEHWDDIGGYATLVSLDLLKLDLLKQSMEPVEGGE